MKGFIELTDSLGRRCTIKANCITRVCERTTYRYRELEIHPELGNKNSKGEWEHDFETTCVQSIVPCDDLYVKESYEIVLKMIEEALE